MIEAQRAPLALCCETDIEEAVELIERYRQAQR
jgi:hypothetical protein